MRDRADMVLVRVGDHQPQQLVAAVRDEAGVGDHDIDLGVLRPAEADAAIDRQPLTVATVEVEVHADLARPAERQEGQVACFCIHIVLLLPHCERRPERLWQDSPPAGAMG